MAERLTIGALLRGAKLARRGLARIASRSMTVETLLQEAGVDVDRLVRERSAI
jgi:hypothetical protein